MHYWFNWGKSVGLVDLYILTPR